MAAAASRIEGKERMKKVLIIAWPSVATAVAAIALSGGDGALFVAGGVGVVGFGALAAATSDIADAGANHEEGR